MYGGTHPQMMIDNDGRYDPRVLELNALNASRT